MNTKLVAIVTGASSGIGLGITRALLEHGYRVVANSRTISTSKDLNPSADLLLVDGIARASMSRSHLRNIPRRILKR